MANKKLKKVPLDRDCLMDALQLRNRSIRKIGADYAFGWSSRSVARGIKDGEISPQLMDALGQYLDVDTDYLSGKYHREAEKIKDESLCVILKSQLKAKKFPYILKRQRVKYGGKFVYERYLEYILIIHDISKGQFDKLLFDKQKAFQLDLEDAIAPVLIKHFPYNALGQDIWPAIHKLKSDIENYDPDEPEIPEDFIMVESDETEPFKDKYSDFQIRGGSDNENQKQNS